MIFSSQVSCRIKEKSWESTHYIYLAKLIYIFKVESVVTPVAGELDKSLEKLAIKVHEKQESLNTVHYYFEVKDVLYGKDKSIYHLEFHYKGEYKECNLGNDFANHKDVKFWNKEIGRSISTNWPINHSIYSCFNIDKQYLIIGNFDFGVRQFEIINSTDDEWLKYVKEKIKKIVPKEGKHRQAFLKKPIF
jgi:hypothetical protein